VSVPAGSIAGGTDEIQRNNISESVLEMPKEPREALAAEVYGPREGSPAWQGAQRPKVGDTAGGKARSPKAPQCAAMRRKTTPVEVM
jgi:hypothetical protein